MTIFVYKGFTKNPEIGNTPFRVLGNLETGVRFAGYSWNLLQNTWFAAFLISELLKDNQCKEGQNYPPPSFSPSPPRLMYEYENRKDMSN